MDIYKTEPARREIAGRLLERFLKYVQVWTTSDPRKADDGVMPSTDGQREFARLLAKELKEMGFADTVITEYGYVCSRIPASAGCENIPPVCLLAHLDTSSEVSGKNVCPIIHENYDGTPILLSEEVVIDPEGDSDLRQCAGETLVTSDGSTLLGADDKAGITVIMTVLERLRTDGTVAHGPIEIMFSPDEETGHGMDKVPLDWIRSKAAYTLDGGQAPILEAECFTAWKADVTFSGHSRHLGTARPDMVNAVVMAASFVALLPRTESPETTDGYQGYYCPLEINGQLESASVAVFLRDFSADGMKRRLETVELLAKAVEAQFPGGKVSVTAMKQYENMKENINKNPAVTDILVRAVKNAGLSPAFKPIRGGTDGSRLTEMGIPCPNIFTGGHNFHSRTEWVSLDQMTDSAVTVMELLKLWAECR